MIKKLMPEWLKRLYQSPIDELSRWQYGVRFMIEVCRHGVRQLHEVRASHTAAALAFRTIFGLVPLVVVGALLFRAFGGDDAFVRWIERLLMSANLYDVAGPDAQRNLGEWTRNIIQQINERMSAQTIGVVGGLVLVWGAIQLLATIERSFNQICQCQEHRSLGRRIPLYWTSVTIGPALLYIGFEGAQRLQEWMQFAPLGEVWVAVIGFVITFAFVWMFLLGMYLLVPHTRVRVWAAVIGSFVATMMWTVVAHAFGWYIGLAFSKGSSALNVLYGTLGLIPIFLLWVYLLWLITLYGLQISHILQVVGGRLDQRMPDAAAGPMIWDPVVVVPVVQAIAHRFEEGLTSTRENLAETCGIHPAVITQMLDILVRQNILRPVADQEDHYVLARPAEQLMTHDLIEAVQKNLHYDSPTNVKSWQWVQQYRNANLNWKEHQSIAELAGTKVGA